MGIRIALYLGLCFLGLFVLGQNGGCSCYPALYVDEEPHYFAQDGSKFAEGLQDTITNQQEDGYPDLSIVIENETREQTSRDVTERSSVLPDTKLSESSKEMEPPPQVRCTPLPKLVGVVKGFIGSLAFHPNEALLAVGTSSGDSFKVYDLTTRKPLSRFSETTESVYELQFSPSGSFLSAATMFEVAYLYDVATGQKIRKFPQDVGDHTGYIFTAVFSPDGKQLATGSEDKKIILWETQTSQKLKTLKGHTHVVESIVFHPTQPWLASASYDRTVKLWDTAKGQEIKTLIQGNSAMTSVAFSRNGQYLAAGQAAISIHVWETTSWKKYTTLSGHTSWIHRLIFHPNNGVLISSGDSDKTIRFWDIHQSRLLLTLTGANKAFRGLAFAPKSGILAAGDLNDVWLWHCTF